MNVLALPTSRLNDGPLPASRGLGALLLSYLLFACAGGLLLAPAMLAQEPPDTPPDHWGPVSINLEDVAYPHPVSYVEFTLYGEEVRMAYMDVAPVGEDQGQTVVLLHGGNYFAPAWEGTIDALAQAGFRVVAMDQIGYGRSSKPIIPYSLNMHAANIARVLDELEIERAAVVGHSFGGMKASRFALLYPDRTTHVALVNAIGLADGRAGRGWSEPRPAAGRSYEAAVRTIRGHVAEWDEAYMEYVRIHYGWGLSGDWPRLAMVRALNGDVMRSSTVVHDWPQIEAPALVVGGELDGPRFPELARDAAAAFPNGQVVLFPDVGHNPHWEAPDLLNPALVEFLGSADGSDADTGTQQLPPEQEAFWERLTEHCGNAYAGEVADVTAYYEGALNYERLVAHWRECDDERIHIAVHVDDDRSRNWLLTREEGTILLKHDHRDEDGVEEEFTQYGGLAPVPGLPHRQIFEADEHTGRLYPARSDNFWFMHFVEEKAVFAYGVHWPEHGHSIRREFDLSTPVETPPDPWGY